MAGWPEADRSLLVGLLERLVEEGESVDAGSGRSLVAS
jgi:hypothetical protein